MNRVDEVAPLLDAAEAFLTGLDYMEQGPILAEIALLRSELENRPDADEERFLAAARNQLRHARSEFEAGRERDVVEQSLDKALEYLNHARSQFHAPILADAAGLRAQLGVPTEVSAAPPPPVARADDRERRSNLDRAWAQVRQGQWLVESQNVEGMEDELAKALQLVAEVSDGTKAELLSEIDQIRAQSAGVGRADVIRELSRALDVHLSSAESSVAYEQWSSGRGALRAFHERSQQEDVAHGLPPEILDRFRERAARVAVTIAAGIKGEQLDRAHDKLAELEQLLAGDPLAGLDQPGAYRLTSDAGNLKERVLHELSPLPADDPDVRAVHARLATVDERLAQATRDWEQTALRAQVVERWEAVRPTIEGWQDEALDAAPPSLYSPNLPKTHYVVRQLRLLLEDDDNQRIRNDSQHDDAIQAIFRQADETLVAAADKLSAGFARILAHAEAMPTPMREDDLEQLLHLRRAAEEMLAGTRHARATLDRIAALDARWQTEYAQEIQARRDLYDKMSVEADAAWPGIVARTGAVADFDPDDPRGFGRTVLLSQARNRCGWEWSDPGYGFAMWHDGAVLAGVFEPHVQAALEHAWYDLKLEVNDRIPWDVVAIVDGRGTIGERTDRTLRDARTGKELGKIEEWPPVECVRLRIIALHAGPVAVGPQP